MNVIKQFLAEHKISAHTMTALWVMADVLWYSNKDFHDYVAGLLMSLPVWLHGIVFGVVVPVIGYLKATKPSQGSQG